MTGLVVALVEPAHERQRRAGNLGGCGGQGLFVSAGEFGQAREQQSRRPAHRDAEIQRRVEEERRGLAVEGEVLRGGEQRRASARWCAGAEAKPRER